MTRMLHHLNTIAQKIEMLPIDRVKRDMAQANFAAAEESLDNIARLVLWLRSDATSTGALDRAQAHIKDLEAAAGAMAERLTKANERADRAEMALAAATTRNIAA